MPSSEPDQCTVAAWLAGDLPPEEAERVERHFQEHPPEEAHAAAEWDVSLFRGLSGELDADDTVMIARVKSGLALGPAPLREDSWKEILAPAEHEGILGTLGDYEVTEVLASGGMATVFKGHDPGLERHAALKALSPEMAENATARKRFLREARAAARLEHEHVLPVYGVHDEAVPWFAMRYVKGETLQERIDRGVVFSPSALASLARQIAAGLEAAHAEGIVHRDIKPANVLFDGDSDRLWVCDFGIARCSEDPSLTYPGAIAGTPHFMSPEQARGEEVDGRSDLFSLGVVLHSAATGRHPFAGETTAAVLRRVEESKPPSMTRAGVDYPRWMRGLVSALLVKDRDRRPASAAEVLAWIAEERVGAPPAPARRLRRAGWVALAALAATTALAAALLWIPVRDHLPRGGFSRVDRARLAAPSVGAGGAGKRAEAGESGTVELAETGEIFSSLEEALGATPGSATLLLRGRLECPDILYGGVGQKVHLLAAPGASPVVASTHRDEHALFLQGPTRVSGIRFERNESSGSGRPILGFLSDEHEVVVEDCVFAQRYGTDGQRNFSPALGITGTERAIVRRCLFQGGSGLWLAFAEHRGALEADIRVEDCVFDNARGLRLHAWVPSRGISLRMERCVGRLDDFTEMMEGSERMRVDFDLRDCLMDAENSCFFTGASSMAPFLERINWTGRGNVFRAGVPITDPALPYGGMRRNLRERIWAAGQIVENPIDRSSLGAGPVGVVELREALSSEAPGAARDTLELFVP